MCQSGIYCINFLSGPCIIHTRSTRHAIISVFNLFKVTDYISCTGNCLYPVIFFCNDRAQNLHVIDIYITVHLENTKGINQNDVCLSVIVLIIRSSRNMCLVQLLMNRLWFYYVMAFVVSQKFYFLHVLSTTENLKIKN